MKTKYAIEAKIEQLRADRNSLLNSDGELCPCNCQDDAWDSYTQEIKMLEWVLDRVVDSKSQF